jgi:hypothetical protein
MYTYMHTYTHIYIHNIGGFTVPNMDLVVIILILMLILVVTIILINFSMYSSIRAKRSREKT